SSPVSRLPPQPFLVGTPVHGAPTPDRRRPLGSTQRAAGVAGPRGAARRRALREPRVRPAGRRAWAPGPAAPDAPRRRSALAPGFRHRLVRRAGPLLVPLDAGSQRPAVGRWECPVGRRHARDVRCPGEWAWTRGRYGAVTR